MGTELTEINNQLNSIIFARDGLVNVIIANEDGLRSAENRLELATIEYNNSSSTLESTKQGIIIETSGAESKLNSAVYQYTNLNLQLQDIYKTNL